MEIKDLDALNPQFRGLASSGKWTLCIGAGVCRGIVPTWQELTRRLVNETFEASITEADFKKLVGDNSWSLDSWIQACANHYTLTERSNDEFFDLIEKHLYSDLRARARASNLERVLVTVLDKPKNASREDVARVCDFFEAEYETASLVVIAKTLLAAIAQDRLPEAIISFNADTLLHTLIELYQRQEHYQGSPPYSHPAYMFGTVLRPKDPVVRVPIYHCHGAIKPKAAGDTQLPRDSRDRLVFLESEYIRVATTSSSWAETLFMFHAQTTKMLFVGFSMSDPNMRRWLALSNESAQHDLATKTDTPVMAPQHLWLSRTPLPELKTIYKEAMIHLGVRPAWIDDWDHLSAGLANLTSLRGAPSLVQLRSEKEE